MMSSEQFTENPFGSDFDPEELCQAVESGVSEDELKSRKGVGPRGADALPGILAAMQSARVGA